MIERKWEERHYKMVEYSVKMFETHTEGDEWGCKPIRPYQPQDNWISIPGIPTDELKPIHAFEPIQSSVHMDPMQPSVPDNVPDQLV